MQRCLGLFGPTLHKTVTYTVVVHSPQSSQCCPNMSEATLYKKITCAIFPHSPETTLQIIKKELKFCLDLFQPTLLNKEITCGMLAHG